MTAGVTQHHSAEDLQSIPVLGLVLETVTSDPGSPANGRMWHRSDTSQAFIRLGGATLKLGIKNIVNADVDASAAIAESKLALASDAAAGTASRRTLAFTATAAMPGNARLDQIAAPTSAVAFGGQRITNLADPSTGTDAATQQYVLAQIASAVSGQDWKASVRVASSVNVTIASPGANVDSIAMTAGDRVLLRAQSAGAENGIYVWNGAAVPMTRATDADVSAEMSSGTTVPVEDGTSEGIWLLTTNNPITLGTTALTFTQIGGAGTTYTASTGITLVGNDFRLVVPVSVANGGTGGITAAAARTSLNVPQRGFVGTTGAITGGSSHNVAHGLGHDDLNVAVYITSTMERVAVWHSVDATNVVINVAVSQSAGFYTVVATPAS